MTELLTVEEAAKICNLHPLTIRRHIKQGKLKAIKVGGRIRVKREDLDQFMQSVAAPAKIPLPPFKRASPEEIARRRKIFAEVMRLREEIGPIGIPADELVREGREEEESSYA